jgi:lipopolysaccharide biosynthesis regulator YciM
MQKPQLILISAGIALVGLLYFAGNRIPPKEEPKQAANRDGEQKGPMQGQTIEPASFEQIKAAAFAKINAEQKLELQNLENKNDIVSFKLLSEKWHALKENNMSAKYFAEYSKLEKSEKNLTFASENFIGLLNNEPDASVKAWQANQAIEVLNKVIEINPKNTSAQIALATCYTDGTGETMKGVQMLLGIVRKDSNNIPAALTLGALAIKSGQWPKAITRFEGILQKDPKNKEAMYSLAEAYKGSGNIVKAKELFNNCKKLVNNPSFSKEIDEYIKTF